MLEREEIVLNFNKIRVLETGYRDGAWNMALDEVLMSSANEMPILRIYGWSPPCVSIGYFQTMEDVNVENCRKAGVDIIRRITGGGAVFHDCELTYSFITRKYPPGILDSYRTICNVIMSALNRLGLDARFSPLNDITVNGKKVCGNAQTRKKNTLLQHGTILLNVNVEKMFSFLNVAPEKIGDKEISDIKERVAGVNKKFDEMADSLKQSASEIFNADLLVAKISQQEKELAENLALQKYSSDKWNFRR